MHQRPYIHTFQLYQEFYLYDVNTNTIMEIPETTYTILNKIRSLPDHAAIGQKVQELSETDKTSIAFLEQQGLLTSYNEQLIIKHTESNNLEQMYEKNLQVVTLQVTQNCNLRCKYCVYSGSYINRKHTNKRMDWDTAKQAIDFLYHHSGSSSHITIGFYGGEPLLEIALIRKAVQYAAELFNGKELNFNMTTNATLLTQEIVHFLVLNHFNLAISLDGPQNVQDGNRIFADYETGTFDVVMNRLTMIKKLYPEFLKNIIFNAVIDLNQNFSCSNEFFLNYETVKDVYVMGNSINAANRKEELSRNNQYFIEAQYEEFKVFLYYCTDIFKHYRPTLLSGRINGIRQNFYNRTVAKSGNIKQDCPGGQCLPGIQRFFVTVEGKFFPCERVNEEADAYCIGTVQEGFDIQKAQELLNIGQLTEKECKYCWCFKLCSQCAATAEWGGKLSKAQRLSNCAGIADKIENDMKDYIVLMKNGCDFEKME